METELLYEFYILSQTLNFSRAAEMLFISQGSLSRHIQELEKALGTKLLLRSTHNVMLTEAGQHLAAHVQPLLTKCRNAENLLHIQNLSTSGTIRIACELEISYASHIMIFMNRFLERYPDINIIFNVLSESVPPTLLSDYDFVFTPCDYGLIPDSISRILLHRHRIYLAVPPGHRLITRQSLLFSDIVGETVIVPFMEEVFGPYRQNYILAEKYTHNRIISLPAPNVGTALFWVSINKGVCMVPRYARKIAPGEIFLSSISNPECCFNEFVYYNHTADNKSAHLFYEELCASFIHA